MGIKTVAIYSDADTQAVSGSMISNNFNTVLVSLYY